MKNLKKEYEDKTGASVIYTDGDGNACYTDEYVEWLEIDMFTHMAQVCPECKHKGLYASPNPRSDATFKHHVYCKHCGKWVGTIRWDDEFKWLAHYEKI